MSRRTRKLIIVTVLVALVISLLGYANLEAESATSTETELLEAQAISLESTFRIHGRSCAGAVTGTGFVLGDQLVTNGHVTPAADLITTDTPAGSIVLPVSYRSALADVAFADFIATEAPPAGLTLATSDPEVGTPVVIIGHPGGAGPELIETAVHLYGRPTDWNVAATGERVMLIDTVTSGGYSGGPVVNRSGEVVGMLQGIDEATGLTLAIPASELQLILTADRSATRAPLSNCTDSQKATEKQ